MAAHIGVFVAKEADQSRVSGASFDSGVDVICCDVLPGDVEGVRVAVDGDSLVVVASGHDVVDSSSQGFDRAVDGLGAINVNNLAFGAVLLIGDADGGVDSLVEGFQWGVIGDALAVGISKGNAVH